MLVLRASQYSTSAHRLLRLHETGLLRVGLKRSMVAPASCGNGSGYSSAGLGHVLSALGILGSGIAAAVLLLIAEFAWHHHRHTGIPALSQ